MVWKAFQFQIMKQLEIFLGDAPFWAASSWYECFISDYVCEFESYLPVYSLRVLWNLPYHFSWKLPYFSELGKHWNNAEFVHSSHDLVILNIPTLQEYGSTAFQITCLLSMPFGIRF